MEEHKHEHCDCHEHSDHHHEHGCSCHDHGGHHHHHHGEEKELSVKAIVTAGVLFVIGILLEHLPLENWLPGFAAITIPGVKLGLVGVLSMLCYLAAYLICGKDVVVGAISNVIHGEFLDEAFLMTVSSIGALVLGEYGEATAIMILYQVGEKFEDYAVEKSRDAIGEIAKLRPDKALVKKGDGQEEQAAAVEVPAADVEIGSIIIVKPGDRIPIDGVIVTGESFLDTSALTGESVPKKVCIGDEVLSGSINKQGLLEIRTTKLAGDSALARILELVENATENKTKSEQFVTRFAKVYTPIVCGAALVLAIIPPLFTRFFMPSAFALHGWRDWIYRALEFLVVSCPCALVISIPLSFCSGITACAKKGILIKGSVFLEALAKTKTAVFDKTGTLTKGNFIVTDIHPMNPEISKQELIAIATHAEMLSNHPISASLRAIHHENCCDEVKLENVEEITSKGIKAVVNGKNVLAGNEALLEMFNVKYPECPEHQDGTIVHIACNGEYAGHIVISDEVKADSAETISSLKKIGVENVVMLTGDNEKTARTVAERLGIHKVYGQMMSADKLAKVEELLKELEAESVKKSKKRGTLIFTGDGINDAPVLARADVGIAMGAMGSDAAVEAGDVVIMEDNPLKIAEGIKASRRTLGIVHQNLYGSLGIKAAILLLSALGITNMWIAVFGDVGVTILAVLNSLRLLRQKD
ncbi:MAG: cadmium-translocating P-type ATPase [Treponema sp.]|nr:cadmium-translocating P-type ATPase [Treponema sp.]